MLEKMELWLSALKIGGKRQGTIIWYRSRITKFIEYLNEFKQGITPVSVDLFLQKMLACTVEGRKGYWRAIRAFTNWASNPRRAYLPPHPLDGYDPAYPKAPRKVPPRRADLLALIERLPRSSMAERRNRCYIHTLYFTGLRASDALCIRLKDINLDRKCVNVFIHKTNEFQLISLVNPLLPELIAWIGHCGGEWLFPGRPKGGGESESRASLSTVEHNWTHFQRSIAPATKPINLHMLRHAFGTHAREAGLDLVDIKDLMGHASLAATQIYAVASPEHMLKTANRIWA